MVDEGRGKYEVLADKPTTLSTINPTSTGLGSNRALRGEKLRSSFYLGLSATKRDVWAGTYIHIQTDRQTGDVSITAFILCT